MDSKDAKRWNVMYVVVSNAQWSSSSDGNFLSPLPSASFITEQDE